MPNSLLELAESLSQHEEVDPFEGYISMEEWFRLREEIRSARTERPATARRTAPSMPPQALRPLRIA